MNSFTSHALALKIILRCVCHLLFTLKVNKHRSIVSKPMLRNVYQDLKVPNFVYLPKPCSRPR